MMGDGAKLWRAPALIAIDESDSSGRDGVQASARVCAALGAHPHSVVTQVASRGQAGGAQTLTMPIEAVATQLTELLEGPGADAIKVGALAQARSAAVVAKLLSSSSRPLVVDPRLFDRFSKRCAMESLDGVIRDKVLKIADVACLNIFEAEALALVTVRDMDSRRDALKALFDLGVSFPVIMSSKNDRHAVDLGYDGYGFYEFGDDRVEVEFDGGAGAVFSTAVAVEMARGAAALEAVEGAKAFVTASIRHAVKVGEGLVAVNPLWSLYESRGLSFEVVAEDDGDEQGG